MATAPQFKYNYPIDGVTALNAAYFVQLQNNMVSYVSQFLPLAGAQMLGPILWDPGQVFPAAKVTIPNPTYPHTGYYVTLADHINDPIHGASQAPLPHAKTHAVNGSDPLFGTTIPMGSGGLPTIKSYVDTQVAAASANVYPGPPASARYEIGGADPLYGNLIAVDSAHPTQDMRTYVNNSVSAAIASGGGSTNPTFGSITSSTGIFTTSGVRLSLRSLGSQILTDTTAGTSLLSSLNTTPIFFGYTGGTRTEYGQVSTSGYTIGSSNYGPTGMLSNGAITANGDLQSSRSAAGSPGQGALFLGSNTNAYLTYAVDVPGQFYTSKPITFGDNVTIAAGKSLTIPGIYSVGSVANVANNPGIRSDGSSIVINAKNGTGTAIYLGLDNASLNSIQFGPASAWGIMSASGLTMGSTVISASAGAIAGSLSLNGGGAAQPGDLAIARSGSSGVISFGRGAQATIDWGAIATSTWTFTNTVGTIAQIKNDGTFASGVSGSSTYGPAAAAVAGTISATKAITAGTGVDLTGASGFSFGTLYNTGVFSASAGDLRLLVNGTPVATYGPSGPTIAGNSTFNGTLTASSLSVTGAATVSGTLSLNGPVQTAATTITKFRVKFLLSLGFNPNTGGTGSTPTVGGSFGYVPIPSYSGGQVEAIRITALTADTGTPTTFTIYKNATVIGTVALGAGQTTAFALPSPNPSTIAVGDTLHAVCTQSGGATGLSVFVEGSQLVY